jgi:hypothetical protein
MEQQTRVERRDRSRALLQLAEAERRAKGEPLPSVPLPCFPTRKALKMSVSSRNLSFNSLLLQLPRRSPLFLFRSSSSSVPPVPLPFRFHFRSSSLPFRFLFRSPCSSSFPLPLPFLFLFRSSSSSAPLPLRSPCSSSVPLPFPSLFLFRSSSASVSLPLPFLFQRCWCSVCPEELELVRSQTVTVAERLADEYRAAEEADRASFAERVSTTRPPGSFYRAVQRWFCSMSMIRSSTVPLPGLTGAQQPRCCFASVVLYIPNGVSSTGPLALPIEGRALPFA